MAVPGTVQVNYAKMGFREKYYALHSGCYLAYKLKNILCIVVVHKPSNANNNYYGADVAGPVFKRIARKDVLMRLRQPRLQNIDR
jgi:cell division protein FtsI (penicillin-binding protein 3)